MLDPRDRDHKKASQFAKWIEERQVPVITTWEIVVETVTLLRYRHSYRGAMVFIDVLLPGFNIVYITEAQRTAALECFRKLSRDKKLSLCDAISYVVMTKLLPGLPCIAFDDDFKRLGLTVLDEAPA